MRHEAALRTVRVSSSGPWVRARGLRIAALMLATGGWLWVTDAHAGCSHLVTSRMFSREFKPAPFDRLVLVRDLSETLRRPLLPTAPTRTPCAGFRCSDSVPLAPLAAPRALPRIDACSHSRLATLMTSGDGSLRLPFVDDPPYALELAERLCRPPR
jgi:hypothetical protein